MIRALFDDLITSHVTDDQRIVLAARCRRVFRLRQYAERSEVDREALEAALADLHAVCTPETLYALATYRQRYGVPRAVDEWVERLTTNLRALVRRVRRDYVDLELRLDTQRETIRKAHFAVMSRIGVDWHSRSDEITDGLADAIHFIADQRDTARDRADALESEFVMPIAQQLCGECGHAWIEHREVPGATLILGTKFCSRCTCIVAPRVEFNA